jgi:hypothetical protein
MIILKSEKYLEQYLDEPTLNYITEFMKKDCQEFTSETTVDKNVWIGKVHCMSGSHHEGSMIPHGFLLRYQFRKISIGYDLGIQEIKIAESSDDFLDLMNEVRKNPSVFNVVSNKK